jgi:hypothetical protein
VHSHSQCGKNPPLLFRASTAKRESAVAHIPKNTGRFYALDGLLQYDWKDGFASSTAVLSSKWAPVIDYLKTLVTGIL